MRDSQRGRFYRWESEVLFSLPLDINLSFSECQELVKRICHIYNVPIPRFADGRSRRKACYNYILHRISLPRSARTVEIVCHETAHAVIYHRFEESEAWHGAKFVMLLMELLSDMKIAKPKFLQRTAKQYGLKFQVKEK